VPPMIFQCCKLPILRPYNAEICGALQELNGCDILAASVILTCYVLVMEMPVISKRKLESYKRAEAVAQTARKYLQNCHKENPDDLLEHVLHWMKVTGNIKYEKPKPPPKRKT